MPRHGFGKRSYSVRQFLGERQEFPTNSEIPHDSDTPSTMNIDDNPPQDAKNRINAEQDDASDLTTNLGLFDLDPEEIGMIVQACIICYCH